MGISADTAADSAALAERIGVNFPLLSDADVAVAERYGVAMKGEDIAVPSIFVVLPDRRIYWRHVGESAMDRPPERRVLEEIDRALHGAQ